jgi:hypothetical protein
MSRKEFSSGIARLDDLVSGYKPGDTVLTIIGKDGSRDQFVTPFIEARERKIPIVIVSPKHFILGRKKTPVAIISSAKRFLSSNARAALVVVEELSLWKDALKSEKYILLFLEMLGEASAKCRSLTLVAAARGAFALEKLGEFKDNSTICLELAGLRDETIILPLQLKGDMPRSNPFPSGSTTFIARRTGRQKGIFQPPTSTTSPRRSFSRTPDTRRYLKTPERR